MKLLDILKTVGGGIVKSVIPGSGIIGAVNEILTGKKLSNDATGDDVSRAISQLPEGDRIKLLDREFDVKIEKLKTIQAMLTADATAPHSTRPYIAKHSFHIIGFVTVIVIVMWAVAVGTSDETMIKAVMDGWPFILALSAPLVVLLKAYFGVLEEERKTKLNAANGQITPLGGIGEFIGKLIKK